MTQLVVAAVMLGTVGLASCGGGEEPPAAGGRADPFDIATYPGARSELAPAAELEGAFQIDSGCLVVVRPDGASVVPVFPDQEIEGDPASGEIHVFGVRVAPGEQVYWTTAYSAQPAAEDSISSECAELGYSYARTYHADWPAQMA
ncbi:MAG TPA: hypothetical protein GX743_01140 [Actinomycetales bacterium]|nr:hypothetical protein [Actinomycetales bacterium]